MELMVPHILKWEVGQTKEEIEKKIWDKFTPRQIYDRVKSRGYHCIPGDRGEDTMCGVTYKTFTDWRQKQGKPKPTIADLKGLQYDEWLAIWSALHLPQNPDLRIASHSSYCRALRSAMVGLGFPCFVRQSVKVASVTPHIVCSPRSPEIQ